MATPSKRKSSPDKKKQSAPQSSQKKRSVLNGLNILKNISISPSSVVHKAASILEEELAAGIIAARHVEEAFEKLSPAKGQKNDAVFLRFRKDAHEIVDILMDLIFSVSKLMQSSIGRMQQAGGEVPEPQSSNQPQAIPSLVSLQPVKGGSSCSFKHAIINSGKKLKRCGPFYCSDLTNEAGDRISAASVLFSDDHVQIKALAKVLLGIKIKIPAKTKSGLYYGIVQGKGLEPVTIAVTVQG